MCLSRRTLNYPVALEFWNLRCLDSKFINKRKTSKPLKIDRGRNEHSVVSVTNHTVDNNVIPKAITNRTHDSDAALNSPFVQTLLTRTKILLPPPPSPQPQSTNVAMTWQISIAHTQTCKDTYTVKRLNTHTNA